MCPPSSRSVISTYIRRRQVSVGVGSRVLVASALRGCGADGFFGSRLKAYIRVTDFRMRG